MKKLIALLLAVLMLATLMTGCGKKAEQLPEEEQRSGEGRGLCYLDERPRPQGGLGRRRE